jgi:epoxyqueuosine reductase
LTIEHRGEIAPELADAMGDRVGGCDVCQEVCPYNAGTLRSERIPERARLGPPKNGWRRVDLVALVGIGSATYRAWVKDTPLGRIPRHSMRRNALVALGNRPGALGDDERAAVEAALDDGNPLVRAAARRALARRA